MKTVTIDAVEMRDRAEWADIVARHGLSPMAAPELPRFAAKTLLRARSAECGAAQARLRIARRLSLAASAAAACLVVATLVFSDVRATGGHARRGAVGLLAVRQSPDGTWPTMSGDAFAPALTALGAVAAMHGGDGPAAGVARRAVEALESMQNPDGSFGAARQHLLYNHAFATFALLEDAARSGKGITPALSRALAFSVASQTPYATWDYLPGGRGDDALTVWQLGILAKARGLGWNDSRGALRRGVAALGRRSAVSPLDYRLAFGRENQPEAGGLALTRLASSELARWLGEVPAHGRLAESLAASLGTAPGAAGAGDDVFRAILALLD
ncbi:MAG: terpene cyclase/mutase family protein [Kiritimatiellae bacterium]|nr:terpene cyclase/mutase family protein [Kiritimatiellia bacterium]